MAEPILPNLPEIQRQLQNKYKRIGGQVQQLPSSVGNSLIQLDTTRVAKGQAPLTGPETVNAVGAALRNAPITPIPERKSGIMDIPGNFAKDLTDFGRAIPHLPMALVKEGKDLGQFAKIAQEDGILAAPGVRLIPGAYTLNNLVGSGDPSDILRHPLYTALDVLPAAKGIGKIPVGEGTVKSAIVDSSAGNVARSVKQTLASTRPGIALETTFGKRAHEAARLKSEQNRLVVEALQRDTDMAGTAFADDPMVELARSNYKAMETYAHIPPERQASLMRMVERDSPDLAQLAGDELAYANWAKQASGEMAAVKANMGEIVDFKGEWYDQQTGRSLIRNAEQAEYATSVQTIRQGISEPSTFTPNAVTSQAKAIAGSDVLSKVRKTESLYGLSHAMDQMGYDGASVRSTLRLTDPKNPAQVTYADVAAEVDRAVANGPTTAPLNVDNIIDGLKPYSRTVPAARATIENLRAGNYPRARQLVTDMQKGKTTPPELIAALDTVPDAISGLNARAKWLAKTDRYNDRTVARLQKQYAAQEAKTPSARWNPLIQEKVKEGLLAKYSTHPDFDQVAQRIEDGQYSASPELQADARKIANEARGTWQEMEAAGLNPTFIHHVSPGAAKAIAYPKISEVAKTPSSVKRRTLDVTPYAENMSVAMTHEALEFLSRKGSQAYSDGITEMFGRKRFSMDENVPGLYDLYRAKAEALHEVNPSMSVASYVDELMAKEWTRFDPNSLMPWKKGKGTSLTADQEILIPKAVGNVLERISNPKVSGLRAAMDPVMGLFRTSVLALSPRWQFNNLFGNSMMIAMDDPRIFTKVGKAHELMRSGQVDVAGQTVRKLDLERSGVVGTGMGGLPDYVVEWNKTGRIPPTSKIGQALHQLYAGKTMKRLMESGGKVIDKSYAMNGYVDDMYRSAAYLDAYERALTSGAKKVDVDGVTMSREAAHDAGIATTRKLFQNWDAMTPIERDVMRFAMPFYGWTAHIMKYMAHYPIDHPTRAAVMASFARNEVADLRERGLPDSFLNMFFLGNTDENGNQKAVSLGAINPFASVGSSFTLAGLTGNMNPVAGSFLRAMGIDPLSGEAELYPDMSYDPDTGRYGIKTESLLGSLGQSMFPQVNAMLTLVGGNAQYQELLKTNPDSAVNMLRSQAGFPVIFRNVPLVQTQMKSEVVRADDQRQGFNDALKSGNYEAIVNRYPNLAPLMAQIQAMNESGDLDEYRIQQTQPTASTGSMFWEALVARNLPTSQVTPIAGQYELQDQLLQRTLPVIQQ